MIQQKHRKKWVYSILYGVLLIGGSLIVHWLAPEIAKTTFRFGVVCGGLCLFWGALGYFGRSFVVTAGLTVGAMTFVLLSQMIIAWVGSGGGGSHAIAAKVLMTLMFAGSWVTLVAMLYPAGGQPSNPREVEENTQSRTQPDWSNLPADRIHTPAEKPHRHHAPGRHTTKRR